MKLRNSNFEIFRIVAMMGIVAYHTAWYSGLATRAYADPWDWCNALILIFGAWGKTGINCFILITGYFMCQKSLTVGRFLKVIGLTEFYALFVFGVSVAWGWQQFTWEGLGAAASLFIEGINGSFVPSYIVLLALTPLLNRAIRLMGKRMHLIVSGILLSLLSVLPSVGVKFSSGEIPWFVTLYVVAALVRRHEEEGVAREDTSSTRWSFGLGMAVAAAIASMAVGAWLNSRMPGRNMIYYWVYPDPKVLAFGVAFCAFMFFKNLRVQSRGIINAIGGATFGIYLLHDGAFGMFRERFWGFLINSENCEGGGQVLIRYITAAIAVFGVCMMVDIFRKWVFSKIKNCGALRAMRPTVEGEKV